MIKVNCNDESKPRPGLGSAKGSSLLGRALALAKIGI